MSQIQELQFLEEETNNSMFQNSTSVLESVIESKSNSQTTRFLYDRSGQEWVIMEKI
jgi:hypothetical protein